MKASVPAAGDASADLEQGTAPELEGASPVVATATPDVGKPRQLLLRVWDHKWPVAAAFLGLVAASYASYQYFRGERVPVEMVARADLIETVVASGHVESPFRVEIASQIIGTVVSVAVREGETVRQGQTLIVLAAEELLNTAAQAQATVAQADANVRQINELTLPQALEAQRSARASLLSAQQVFGRTSTLMAQGFVTRAYFDQVTRDRDVALTQVGVASAQVRSARSGGSGLAAAAAALTQAKAGSAAAQSRLGYTTISAPRDGVLISRSVERGMVVTPGATLMLLSPGGDMQIVLQIDERNLSRIAIGQTARVSADAYPGQRFAAIVSFINPGIDIARASAVVKLTVVNPPAYLRQNMTVSVDIETARRAQALSLPGSAVHDALTAAPWVLVMEDGRAVRRPVRLGLQGDQRIEILGGLDAGAKVILATSDVAAGARVRATTP